jgi:hypothetical protein
VQRNLKCVQLSSRVGICQQGLVQGTYLRRTALQVRLGYYSINVKVTDLTKTIRVERKRKILTL